MIKNYIKYIFFMIAIFILDFLLHKLKILGEENFSILNSLLVSIGGTLGLFLYNRKKQK